MICEYTQTRGDMPTAPDPVSVALEASVPNERAATMIAAAWSQAEAYTGRLYWPASAATSVAVLDETGNARWPRSPFPAALTVEAWQSGAWAAYSAEYVPETGEVLDLPAGRYRLTAASVEPGAPEPHVVEAVRALTLYQLIHSPARREFRTITAADSTLTRERLDGLFRASGAGILLACDVRW